MRARPAALVPLALLLVLTACGDRSPTSTATSIETAKELESASPIDRGADERTSALLAEELSRRLTPDDVEEVLRVTPIVEDEGRAANEPFPPGRMKELEWSLVAARVSIAYARLLLGADGLGTPVRAPQLKADIEVVRPFRTRLDAMHAARRAREDASADRSGETVTLPSSELVAARRVSPDAWERFTDPITGGTGYRVRASLGEQILVVESRGSPGPTTRRFALAPGGCFVEDARGITIRPRDGSR